MSTANSTPQIKVHALLVGINDYKGAQLYECLNDIAKVNGYLENNTNFECEIEKLENEKATKTAIVKGFETISTKIEKDETFLFYFTGHGTEEEADPKWEEPNGKLQCIVCYYDDINKSPHDFLLVDKELRYLIKQLSEKCAHIVTIFDCCHSGDNTREIIKAAFPDQEIKNILREKSIRRVFPKRDLNKFIFNESIYPARQDSKLFKNDLPQGVHVQLAACQPYESAWEGNGGGEFTDALLKVLKDADGNVSYFSLWQRTRQYLKFKVTNQHPSIYIYGSSDEEENTLRNTIFLNKEKEDSTRITEAIHNSEWSLNKGAIHGLTKSTKVQLEDKLSGKWFPATVEELKIDTCTLKLDTEAYNALHKQLTCKALVEGLKTSQLKLALHNHDGIPEKEVLKLQEALNKNSSGHYIIAGDNENADYTLHVQYGDFFITRFNDPYRPVVRPIESNGDGSIQHVIDDLKHISKWHFIKELKNDNPDNFQQEPLKIEVKILDEETKIITEKDNEVVVNYQLSGEEWKSSIQIKITNQTNKELHICAAWLIKDYSSYLNVLEPVVQVLEPGKSTKLKLKSTGSEEIPLKLSNYIIEYNWKEYEEAIKFILSNEPFDVNSLNLNKLNEPYTLKDRNKNIGTPDRRFRSPDIEPEISRWGTQTFRLIYPNPTYNKIKAAKLNAMMEWDRMAFFAAGLYCNVSTDETLQQSELSLKPEIELIDSPGEKGIFDNAKINLANKIERMMRERRYNKVKDKLPRIVAEGDSWFQYPIVVKDILDHLSGLFAVKSLASAGDTLRNYMLEAEFIRAVDEEKPDFFLISGGGNDILGKQFKEYIVDAIDNSIEFPKRYIKNTLYEELDKLIIIYDNLFETLLIRFPDLPILYHGYDYIIPLDTTLDENKGKPSWLGKHMIEKGIERQEDRIAIIHHIIDEFNERLKTLADKFKDRVSYIDLRKGVTTKGDMYDEIHHTNKGFQDIAMAFLGEMNRITKKRESISKLLINQ